MDITKIPYNKGVITSLGMGGLITGATINMYNNYEKDLDYARRMAVRKANANAMAKQSGIIDSVKDRLVEPAVRISKNEDTVKIDIKTSLPKDLYNAATTFAENDPGDHKKKALLGAVGTVAGIIAAKHYLGDGVAEKIQDQLKPKSPSPYTGKLVAALLSASTPAAIYYAVQNRDRPTRAGLGGAVAAGSIAAKNEARKNIVSTGIPQELRVPLAKANASVALAAGSGLYTLHQLQAAADEAKLQALATADMSEVDKAKEVNRVRSRKDLLTRYPVLRPAPYVDKLRSVYNKFHQPEPRVSASDYIRYVSRGQ